MAVPRLPSELRGDWIWKADCMERVESYVFLRGEFTLSETPETAELWIAAHTGYHLYINDRYFCRGPSPSIPNETYVSRFDVGYCLEVGRNLITILAHNTSVPRCGHSRRQRRLHQLDVLGRLLERGEHDLARIGRPHGHGQAVARTSHLACEHLDGLGHLGHGALEVVQIDRVLGRRERVVGDVARHLAHLHEALAVTGDLDLAVAAAPALALARDEHELVAVRTQLDSRLELGRIGVCLLEPLAHVRAQLGGLRLLAFRTLRVKQHSQEGVSSAVQSSAQLQIGKSLVILMKLNTGRIGHRSHVGPRVSTQRLRLDPALGATAVEELLRYDSPAQFTRRIARSDLKIGDRRIPAGSVIFGCLGAANRDTAKMYGS